MVASRFKVLSEAQLARVFQLLSEAWVEGNRQNMALFLSGYMAKHMIHPVSVAELLKRIAVAKNDAELEQRLSAVYYTYRKAFGDIDELKEVDRLIEAWKSQGIIKKRVSKGVKIVAEDIQRLKGESGLIEILRNLLGDEKARHVMDELEKVITMNLPANQKSLIFFLKPSSSPGGDK